MRLTPNSILTNNNNNLTSACSLKKTMLKKVFALDVQITEVKYSSFILYLFHSIHYLHYIHVKYKLDCFSERVKLFFPRIVYYEMVI